MELYISFVHVHVPELVGGGERAYVAVTCTHVSGFIVRGGRIEKCTFILCYG